MSKYSYLKVWSFCTPPICVDPPNEDESPPPFGFEP
jgi:hypothetical protein